MCGVLTIGWPAHEKRPAAWCFVGDDEEKISCRSACLLHDLVTRFRQNFKGLRLP